MKENIIIIGHTNHGKSTLTSALQKVIDEEVVMMKDDFQEPIKITNYPSLLNEKQPSKSTLKKCAKGLHEYKCSEPVQINEYTHIAEWNCIHCNKPMRKQS